MKFEPRNYSCAKCGREQYTNKKCYECGSKLFVELRVSENISLTLTEDELDIIRNWGFIVSTERPLSEKDRELYFKITNG